MIFKADILNRIHTDFTNEASMVLKIFEEAIAKADYLNSDRILRCILFLAEGDIEKLRNNIEVAIFDPRDVMLWAEYANNPKLETSKRIRDFNNVFEQAELITKK